MQLHLKFIKILSKYKYFIKIRLGLPKIIKTKQGKFFIRNPNETIQKCLLKSGEFEIKLVELAIALAKQKEGTIVDIGANIGTFTIPLAHSFLLRDVFAFEPQRNIFHHLSANIFINNLTNVISCRMAVGQTFNNETKIEVPLFDFNENYTGSVTLDKYTAIKRSKIAGIAEPSLRSKQHDLVDLVNLDEIELSEISLIKIDVEGMELSVLRSAERTIRRDLPIIFFETWDIPDFHDANCKIIDWLSVLGYVCFNFGNDSVACHEKDTSSRKIIENILC